MHSTCLTVSRVRWGLLREVIANFAPCNCISLKFASSQGWPPSGLEPQTVNGLAGKQLLWVYPASRSISAWIDTPPPAPYTNDPELG